MILLLGLVSDHAQEDNQHRSCRRGYSRDMRKQQQEQLRISPPCFARLRDDISVVSDGCAGRGRFLLSQVSKCGRPGAPLVEDRRGGSKGWVRRALLLRRGPAWRSKRAGQNDPGSLPWPRHGRSPGRTSLAILLGVDFSEGAELGVRAEDEVDDGGRVHLISPVSRSRPSKMRLGGRQTWLPLGVSCRAG